MMMNLLNIFYKSRTFFFSMYFICHFFSTESCVAKNIEISATSYHTKNEPYLFAFSTKNFTANIINPFAESNFYVWVILPAIAIAYMTGYLAGKKRGKKKAIARDHKVDVAVLPVANHKDKYDEMIEKKKPFIQKYEMVTVLFADIVGFTEITDILDPETLLNELNGFFFYFDTVVDQYHIEKIKTMGDAYMCAGGIPQKNHTNPVDVVMVALDVQNHLNLLSMQNPSVWSVRIGIHTGQVVAGMLGHKKMSYDIWGHTVNVASRLETSCVAGKVQISGATYEKIKRFFDCEYQGTLPVTNDLTYFVNGLKPEFVDESFEDQYMPNEAFFMQMQLLRLHDVEEYVKNMMADAEPNLFFHNLKHIQDVYEQVELLAYSENIEEKDMLLLKTAALLHDIGYAISYEKNIHLLSEDVARESLPLFQYTQQQIETVCELMKATDFESIPNGIMEKIMYDAHHMYFGRADYLSRTMCLYLEQEKHGIHVNKSTWLQNQIKRLRKHQFYTSAAKKLAKVPTDQHIAELHEQKESISK